MNSLPRGLGLWTRGLDAVPTTQAKAAATLVEDLGFGALWYGETTGREPFVSAALLLAATKRLVVGTAIANIWGRDAVASNAAARTLGAAFDGRFILGLGVGHRRLIEERRGGHYSRPLSTMRAYLEAIDAADFDVADNPPSSPRLLGALGPKMLELSRTHADGAFPYLTTAEYLVQAREILGADRSLVIELPAVLGSSSDEALQVARRHLSHYLRLENYRNHFLRQGYSEQDLSDGGSERMVRDLVSIGGPDHIEHRASEYFAAGADHVVIQVLGPDRQYLPLREWESLAPLVARFADRSALNQSTLTKEK